MENPRYDSPLHAAFFAVASKEGIHHNPDFNDWNRPREGYGEFQVTQDWAVRADMYSRALKANSGRRNIKVRGKQQGRGLEGGSGGAREEGIESSEGRRRVNRGRAAKGAAVPAVTVPAATDSSRSQSTMTRQQPRQQQWIAGSHQSRKAESPTSAADAGETLPGPAALLVECLLVHALGVCQLSGSFSCSLTLLLLYLGGSTGDLVCHCEACGAGGGQWHAGGHRRGVCCGQQGRGRQLHW